MLVHSCQWIAYLTHTMLLRTECELHTKKCFQTVRMFYNFLQFNKAAPFNVKMKVLRPVLCMACYTTAKRLIMTSQKTLNLLRSNYWKIVSMFDQTLRTVSCVLSWGSTSVWVHTTSQSKLIDGFVKTEVIHFIWIAMWPYLTPKSRYRGPSKIECNVW